MAHDIKNSPFSTSSTSNPVPDGAQFSPQSEYKVSSTAEYSLNKDQEESPTTYNPLFALPSGSLDLPIPNALIFRVLSIYELLRKLSPDIRLTIYRVETFCFALSSEDNTHLITETMICLLRTIFNCNESPLPPFSSSNHQLSFELLRFLMDDVTFYEVFRRYTASLPSGTKECKLILSSASLPFLKMEERVTLLEFLCEKCIDSLKVSSSPLPNPNECKKCSKSGKLTSCSICGSNFHKTCIPITNLVEEGLPWVCVQCRSNMITGVQDSVLGGKAEALFLNPSPIGEDRSGRKYYYLARRVIVLTPGGARYYSSTFQLEKLVKSLDANIDCEKCLLKMFCNTSDIFRFFCITEKLTDEGSRKAKLQSFFNYESSTNVAKNSLKVITKPVPPKDDSHVDKPSSGDNVMLRKSDGTQVKVKVHKVFLPRLNTHHSAPTLVRDLTEREVSQLYVLGKEMDFREYINKYTKEVSETSRKKYLAQFFSFSNELKWNLPPSFGRAELVVIAKSKLLQLESLIPDVFMSRLWGSNKKNWHASVHQSQDHSQIGKALSALQQNIRPLIFLDSWDSAIGTTREISGLYSHLDKYALINDKPQNNTRINGEVYREFMSHGWSWCGRNRKHRFQLFSATGLSAIAQKIEEIISRSSNSHYAQSESDDVFYLVLNEIERANSNFASLSPCGVSVGLEKHLIFPHWSTSECQLDKLLDVRLKSIESLSQDLSQLYTIDSHNSMTPTISMITNEPFDQNLEKNYLSFKKHMDSLIVHNINQVSTTATQQIIDVKNNASHWYPDPSEPVSLNMMRKAKAANPSGNKKRDMFFLGYSEHRRLARCGGLIHMSGFLYDDLAARPSSLVKPSFGLYWRFEALFPVSLSQIMFLLRQLNLSLRWQDMNPKQPENISIEILDYKDVDDLNRHFLVRRNPDYESCHTEWVSDQKTLPLSRIRGFCESLTLPKNSLQERKTIKQTPKSAPDPKKQKIVEPVVKDQLEPQKIKVFKKQDGTTYVRGLKLGQKLMQMSDGGYQLISSNPESSAPAYSGVSSRRVEKIPETNGYPLLPQVNEEFFDSKPMSLQPKVDNKQVDSQILHVIHSLLKNKSDILLRNKLIQFNLEYPEKVMSYVLQFGLDPKIVSVKDMQSEDANLWNICSNVMNSMLDYVDREDKISRKRNQTRMAESRPKKPANHKLMAQLEKQKQILRRDIIRKRTSTEQRIRSQVQIEVNRYLENSKNYSAREFNPPSIEDRPNQAFCKSEISIFNEVLVTPKESEKNVNSSTPSRFTRPNAAMDDNKLYCICRTPYDNNLFYIGCDICKNWFHGSCVNLVEEEADKLESYVCDACREKCPSSKPPEVCIICQRGSSSNDFINCTKCQSSCHRACILQEILSPDNFKCPKCQDEQKPEEDKKLYCICKTPYDNTRFYIGCDGCRNWYHGSCVGLSEQQAEKIDSYFCHKCSAKQQRVESKCKKPTKKPIELIKTHLASRAMEEDVSCICRRPYDTREYIGCDKCDDWLHFDCIGITRLDANRLKRYICPRCRHNTGDDSNGAPHQNKLTVQQNQLVLKPFIGEIRQHKMAWPFVEKVNLSEFSDYYDVVSDPIDLNTIEKNTMLGRYKYIDSFMYDVMRIFTNCRMYHQSNTPIYRCGTVMETFVTSRLKNLLKKLNI